MDLITLTLVVICASATFSSPIFNLYPLDSINNNMKVLEDAPERFSMRVLISEVQRTKRNIIKTNHMCAIGYVWYFNRCIPCQLYEELTGEEC